MEVLVFFLTMLQYNIQAYPIAFVLMTHKSQQAYEDIFDYINKSNIFPLSTAKSFTSDYELAMRNALRKLYPHAAMVACLFHFTQAVKRHASQTPGLMDLIKSKPDAASVYYRLQCLPLLHHQFIIDEFKKLRREAFGISGSKRYGLYSNSFLNLKKTIFGNDKNKLSFVYKYNNSYSCMDIWI